MDKNDIKYKSRESRAEDAKQDPKRIYRLRSPTCGSKHACDLQRFPFIPPDHNFVPKINKSIPRLSKKGCKVYEVQSFYRHSKFKLVRFYRYNDGLSLCLNCELEKETEINQIDMLCI